MIPNILAQRYASTELVELFDPINRIRLERKFWIEVLELQKKYGFNLDDKIINSYKKNVEKIDLKSIENREIKTRHDVKAKIEEFNFLAGYEFIHIGMTSRDLTDNIELIQIKDAMQIILAKIVSVLVLLNEKINMYKQVYVVGRTHNVPAQVTTLGKKFANFASELLDAYEDAQLISENMRLRGIRGAIGTNQDSLQFFAKTDLVNINEELAVHYGFKAVHKSVGQIYPRSEDYLIISKLLLICASLNSFAINIRLMSGQGYLSEGMALDQTGSTAMPHKINPRTSERINGLMSLLRGYASIASELSGNQWNEGDVSCSVVRRVIIQDAFFATDGILNSIHNILTNLVIHEDKMKEDLQNNLPFLCSSTILMYLVKSGLGREESHKKIKDLVNRYSQDSEEFKKQLIIEFKKHVSVEQLEKIFQDFASLSGNSVNECESLYKTILKTIKKEKSNLKFEMRF